MGSDVHYLTRRRAGEYVIVAFAVCSLTGVSSIGFSLRLKEGGKQKHTQSVKGHGVARARRPQLALSFSFGFYSKSSSLVFNEGKSATAKQRVWRSGA